MRRPLAIAILVAVVLAMLLVSPLPRLSREFGPLGNLSHAPTFALFAVLGFHGLLRWQCWRPIAAGAVVWVSLVAFGGSVEIVQIFTGRRPSFDDWVADSIGAAAGLAWVAGRLATKRAWREALPTLAGLLVLGVSIPPLFLLTDAVRQRMEMPMLSSLESKLELSRWQAWHCRMERVEEHAADGHWALRADLEPGKYPGVGLIWPYPDWSGRKTFVVDVWLTGVKPLDVCLKIEDEPSRREWDDRFETVLHLEPGVNHIAIPLTRIAAAPRQRRLDLSLVHLVQFFAADLEEPRTFFVDNVHLE